MRRVMLSTYLTWSRRRWRGELPVEVMPEQVALGSPYEVLDLRHSLLVALRELPPRQRAVVVLRFLDDLTEAQTALVLGCTVGTVKSQGAKAMAKLRACPSLQGVWQEEVRHGEG